MTRPEEFVGLSYPERHRLAGERGDELCVYVPVEPLHWLAPGSGIVGRPSAPASLERVMTWYEGWVNGAFQYADLDDRARWEEAVLTAAGRAFVYYPTVACRSIEVHDLRPVGTIRARAGVRDLLVISDEDAVQAWLAHGGPGR